MWWNKKLTNKKCKQQQLQHQHRRYYRLETHIFVVVVVVSVEFGFFSALFSIYLKARKQLMEKTTTFFYCFVICEYFRLVCQYWNDWNGIQLYGYSIRMVFLSFFSIFIFIFSHFTSRREYIYFNWFRALFFQLIQSTVQCSVCPLQHIGRKKKRFNRYKLDLILCVSLMQVYPRRAK